MELRLGIRAEHAGAIDRLDGRNGAVWSCEANHLSERKEGLSIHLGVFIGGGDFR